eukprot:6057943-Amphidinium_carterae.1
MEPGDFCLVKYRGVPGQLWHERLVLAKDPRQLGHYLIETPDGDRYTENYQPNSPDVDGLRFTKFQGADAPGLPPDRIYRFDPLMFMDDDMFQAEVQALAVGYGLPPPCRRSENSKTSCIGWASASARCGDC